MLLKRRLNLPNVDHFFYYRKDSHISKLEKMYELPQISVNLNKANLMMLTEIYNSWLQKLPKPSNLDTNSLLDDVFTTGKLCPLLYTSSQTCMKRSPLGQRKSCLL
jgi:hypothetical protein